MNNNNKRNNQHIINVLVDFLFKNIERSQHTLNKSYNSNHSKRDLFANYLRGAENVTPESVLNSINKPDTIVEIINNMKASLTKNQGKFPEIINQDMITSVTEKLNKLLETATSKNVSASSIKNNSSRKNSSQRSNNISVDELRNIYTRVIILLIRKIYPIDQNRKKKLKYADEQKFEEYIKTDDISVNEVVSLFTTEQIRSMLDVVDKNNLNLPNAVTKRLKDKLTKLLELNATLALQNLNKRLNAEEQKTISNSASEKGMKEEELSAKKNSSSLKPATEEDMKNVFDDSDLHNFIKMNMPKDIRQSLLLRSLKLSDNAENNNKNVTKFINIIETIKSNIDRISKKIRELLNNKHLATTVKSNNSIINDLIQYYSQKYCNVTRATPLDNNLRFSYQQLIRPSTDLLGGARKTLTKRKKISKRLQTKKRRV